MKTISRKHSQEGLENLLSLLSFKYFILFG